MVATVPHRARESGNDGLRVAVLTPATFDQIRGGGERYAFNTAIGLARAADDVVVELIAPGSSDAIKPIGDRVAIRSVCAPIDAAFGDAVGWGIIDAIIDADVVHIHQVFTRFGEVAALAARALGHPLCVTHHGGGTSEVGRKLGLVEIAGAAIAYSEYGSRLYGDATNVVVVEGGVDTDFFTPDPRVIRKGVVFAGRIMPHKGVDAVIRACAGMVPLTVAGTIADARYFRDLQELATGADVRFAIDLDDAELRNIYRQALAVVLPSRHVDMYGQVHLYPELMGLTALEGMASGAPAIVTRTGGLPEYVIDGVTGFVIDSDAQLTERLALLASDLALVERLGSEARRQVVTRWDVSLLGKSLINIYERLLSS